MIERPAPLGPPMEIEFAFKRNNFISKRLNSLALKGFGSSNGDYDPRRCLSGYWLSAYQAANRLGLFELYRRILNACGEWFVCLPALDPFDATRIFCFSIAPRLRELNEDWIEISERDFPEWVGPVTRGLPDFKARKIYHELLREIRRTGDSKCTCGIARVEFRALVSPNRTLGIQILKRFAPLPVQPSHNQ